MYLTSKALGRPRALHDHEQLELLLESFVKQVEEIVSEVDTTVVCLMLHTCCSKARPLRHRPTCNPRRKSPNSCWTLGEMLF